MHLLFESILGWCCGLLWVSGVHVCTACFPDGLAWVHLQQTSAHWLCAQRSSFYQQNPSARVFIANIQKITLKVRKLEAYIQKLFSGTSFRRSKEVLNNENSLYIMLEWGTFWVVQRALRWRRMFQADCDQYDINDHQFWCSLELCQLHFWWNTWFWCSYAV